MSKLYDIIDKLKETGEALPSIRTITFGNLEDVDIKRQTIFPLIHIVPGTATLNGSTISWAFQIHAMDLIDFNKDDLNDMDDPFHGTDNMQDVLSDMVQQLSIMVDKIKRGASFGTYEIVGSQTMTPFFDKTGNSLAGYTLSVTINSPSASVDDGIC
jgi:hypothetical protein